MSMQSRRFVVGALALTLPAFLLIACAGDGTAATVQQAQQPAPAAQPQSAAPALEPQPAVPAPVVQAPAPKPVPASPKAVPSEPKYGGIAVIAHRGDPPAGWDPMRTESTNLVYVADSMYGPGNLVIPCREDVYKICPYLAESWEANSDFTQWTFKVREGVKWHDGQSFTVEDAKFWAELATFGVKAAGKTRLPAFYQSQFGALQEIKALEGNRLRFTFSKPTRFFLETIADARYSTAHPRHLMEPRIAGGTVDIAPADIGWVATGPFKMQKYEKGVLVQLRRFPQYWEKDERGRQLPYLDGITFPIFGNPAAMDAAFRVGRLDGGAQGGIHILTKEREAGYRRDLGDKVWYAHVPGPRSGLGFNVLKSGPVQDRRVRKALSLWVEREAYLPLGGGGYGRLATLLAPDSPFTSPDFLTWPGYNKATREQDRGEAKRLMAEAGYAKGFQMEFPCRIATPIACEFYQGQFAGLGVDVKIIMQDEATYLTRSRLGLDYPAIYGGVGAYVTVPEATELTLAAFSITPYSVAKHEDPNVTGLFKQLGQATSFEERVRLWRQIERYILLEQVHFLTLSQDENVVPWRSYVKGVIVPAENKFVNYDFTTVWLDK